MLGNRHLQVKLVKEAPSSTDAPETPDAPAVDVEQISNLVVKHTEHVVKLVGSAYVAKRLLDCACEIAVIIAKAKIK